MTTKMEKLPRNHSLSAAGVAKPVIFFDDVCVMCNGFVNLLLKVDRREQFLFAPLKGETASKLLPPLPDDPTKWSMVYVDEAGIHDQSDASLEVYRRMGGVWWLLSSIRRRTLCGCAFLRRLLRRTRADSPVWSRRWGM